MIKKVKTKYMTKLSQIKFSISQNKGTDKLNYCTDCISQIDKECVPGEELYK